jgi:hypothetical protein
VGEGAAVVAAGGGVAVATVAAVVPVGVALPVAADV